MNEAFCITKIFGVRFCTTLPFFHFELRKMRGKKNTDLPSHKASKIWYQRSGSEAVTQSITPPSQSRRHRSRRRCQQPPPPPPLQARA
jgi:hypothetical protein